MPELYNKSKNTIKKSNIKTNKKGKAYDKEIKNMPNIAPDSPERHKFPGHSHNPLSAFCYFPDDVSFVNEDPDEEIVLLLRKHPVTNLKWITFTFLMLIAPSFVDALPLWGLLSWQLQTVIMVVWYLITTAFVFEEFLSWFFHVNIITDERIIEVDFVNLIYREITEAQISRIEDTTVEIGGALRTFFNFGTVTIQTAADIPRIEFEDVPFPDKVQRILRELQIEEEVEELEGRIR